MHPLNSKNFGSTGMEVSFYNGSSVVNGYVVKQVGTSRFTVTDGTNKATVSLADTLSVATDLSANPTYFTILVTPQSNASGGSFVASYEADTATLVGAGSGYAANDTITLANSGGATITVNTVSSGAIATFTLTSAGSGVTSLPTNPVGQSATSGAGTGATFNLKWKLSAVTSSGGTGYEVGDTLNFVGMTATTLPTAKITTSTNGAATAVTVESAGSGITAAATSITVNAPAEHVAHIYMDQVMTIEGNTYHWTLGSSSNGSAVIAQY